MSPFGQGQGCLRGLESCNSSAGQWLQLRSSPALEKGTGLQLHFQSIKLGVLCGREEQEQLCRGC